MTSVTSDILIVGGGLSGASAALKAGEKGKDVLLVRRAYGATALGSGCLDVAGDILGVPGKPWEDSPDIRKNVSEIAGRLPGHPYAVVGEDAWSRVKTAGEWILGHLKVSGYEMAGSWESISNFPTVMGSIKSAAFASLTSSPCDLSRMKGARVLMVGISGLSDFNANFASKYLSERLARSPWAWGSCTGIDIVLRGHAQGPLLSQAAAAAMDNPETAGDVIGEVARRAKGKGLTHVFFPPVMGISRGADNMVRMSGEVGVPCAEFLPLSPSVPGMRFQSALDALLLKTGVRIIQGSAEGFSHNGRKITGVSIALPTGGEICEAKAYVLAGGRFIAGGLRSQGRAAMEPLFGLPVTSSDGPMRAGVHVDASMSPCDRDGAQIFENLFCAGSIIGGYDPVGDMCGGGTALLTAVIAAEEASRVSQ